MTSYYTLLHRYIFRYNILDIQMLCNTSQKRKHHLHKHWSLLLIRKKTKVTCMIKNNHKIRKYFYHINIVFLLFPYIFPSYIDEKPYLKQLFYNWDFSTKPNYHQTYRKYASTSNPCKFICKVNSS